MDKRVFCLLETDGVQDIYPLTLTRPVWDLRIGIDTILEKWQSALGNNTVFFQTSRPFLKQNQPNGYGSIVYINAQILPEPELVKTIETLAFSTELTTESGLFIARAVGEGLAERLVYPLKTTHIISAPQHLFKYNGYWLVEDFKRITAGRQSQPINDPFTIVYNESNIFIEANVKIRAAILNAEQGYIYIGQNAEIQAGAIINGNHAILEGAVVNMGAKLRGDSTIGPYCKVGGELSNSVVLGYSNKAHDGFVGNSIIGSWCNLGADTNTSNLKNNYSTVKIYNYRQKKSIDTGEQFCGLIMGDHCKTSINTMLNTGTVVGVGANIFGSGFPPKLIPSFSWGTDGEIYALEAFLETTRKVMARRKLELKEEDKQLLKYLYETVRFEEIS